MANILNIVPPKPKQKAKPKTRAKRTANPAPSNLIQAKKPPAELHKLSERAVWSYTVTHMKKLGTVANVDKDLLSQYCQMYVKWQELQAEADDEEATLENPNTGVIYPHPIHSLVVKASTEVSRLRNALNLGPKARQQQQKSVKEEKASILKKLDEE